MNIRNPSNYENSFWDWTFLNEVFAPTNIRVTDIDGLIERNGFFLFIETKRPNEQIPQGQQILHQRLIDTGVFTVMIIWGEIQQPRKVKITTRKGELCKPVETLDELAGYVKQWWVYANKKKRK